MTHVDIVKNEWLAGYQVVVGRVWAEHGELRVDASDAQMEGLLARYLNDAPRGSAEDVVASLHESLQGDYLFATEPHESDVCGYQQMVVPLRGEEPRREGYAVGA